MTFLGGASPNGGVARSALARGRGERPESAEDVFAKLQPGDEARLHALGD